TLFCEYFQQTQQGGFVQAALQWLCVFYPSGLEGSQRVLKDLEFFIVKYKLFFLIYFSELIKIKSNKQHKKSMNG
ncbi:hypothetical protein MLP81_25275, partial [Escherichia coli]|nr:hypothetical protein [Escherichia coli]MCO0482648.1 hypothetical protein [Escherichia coli]